ncbi:MAG: ankyrin repeat domain-containing protein [Rhodoferax sp.]|nr:ankyrin repeat domain-containing protein [Rhodoferax sp.]
MRKAVLAHATLIISAQSSRSLPLINHKQSAANQSRWKLSMLASVALVGLTGLLVLQFDRSTQKEQKLSLDRPNHNATSSAPAAKTTQLQLEPVQTEKHELNAARPTLQPQDGPDHQEKLTQRASKADSLESRKPILHQEPGVPSTSVVPSPVEQTTASSSQQKDAAPASAHSTGNVESSGTDTASVNTVQRDAKTLSTPSAMTPPRQRLEKSELQTQLLEKDRTGTKTLSGALLDSARVGQVDKIEHLINQGALINSVDEAGRTPLMLATLHGHTAVVARLLALGANPTLTDKQGATALQHARRLGHQYIVDLIEAAL